MENEGEDYTSRNKSPRSNTKKVKKMAKWNRYCDPDNRVAENHRTAHEWNLQKCSWDLRKFKVTGP